METPKVQEEEIGEELPNNPTVPPRQIEVTMGMIREAAYCSKRKAGAGKLPPFLFHILPQEHMEIIRDFIEETVNTGNIDINICKYNLWLIYKGKGSREEAQNFRPIAIATPTYRLTTRIVLGELRKIYNPTLNENQYGFRPKRSCGAATMALREWREQKDNVNGEVVFLDIKKAFDSVSHRKLLKKLEKTCPRNIFNLIMNIYNISVGTSIQGEKKTQFKVKQGVRQGCSLSPLLFILYIDEVLKDLNNQYPESLSQAFADDICLGSPTNARLQEVLDTAIQKLTDIGLQAAPMKFQFLSKTPTNTLKVGDQTIQTVVEAKYLGTTFTATNSPKPAMANAKTEMVRALDILKNTPTTGIERIKFISAVVIPRLVYRITAWGPYPSTDFEDINKEIKKTIKEVKCMHTIMSDKTLYTKRRQGGLGLANPETRTKISTIRIWQETIRHNVKKLKLENRQLPHSSPIKKIAELIKQEGGLTRYDTQDLRMSFQPEKGIGKTIYGVRIVELFNTGLIGPKNQTHSDGSLTNKNMSAGVIREGQVLGCRVNGKCSSYRAEAAGMLAATMLAKPNEEIYCDNWGLVTKIRKMVTTKNFTALNTADLVQPIASFALLKNLNVQWVPGHSKYDGNEQADKAAELAMELPKAAAVRPNKFTDIVKEGVLTGHPKGWVKEEFPTHTHTGIHPITWAVLNRFQYKNSLVQWCMGLKLMNGFDMYTATWKPQWREKECALCNKMHACNVIGWLVSCTSEKANRIRNKMFQAWSPNSQQVKKWWATANKNDHLLFCRFTVPTTLVHVLHEEKVSTNKIGRRLKTIMEKIPNEVTKILFESPETPLVKSADCVSIKKDPWSWETFLSQPGQAL